jgi:polysaccharide biosynthesis transport protein
MRQDMNSTVAIGLGDVLRGMLRAIPMIATFLILGAIAAHLVNALIKPRYVAETIVIIERSPQQQTGVQPTTGQRTEARIEGPTDRDLQDQTTIIKSADITQKVSSKLGLETRREYAADNSSSSMKRLLIEWGFLEDQSRLPSPQRIQKTLNQQVSVYKLPETNLIGIKVTAPSPQLAADIANTYAETYIAASEEKQLGSAGRNREWLARQIDELRPKVVQSEEAAERYRAERGLLKGEQSTLNAQEISGINARITEAEAAKAVSDAKLREVRRLLSRTGNVDTTSEVLNSQAMLQLSARVAAARSKLNELSSIYLDQHPKVVAARRDLNAATAEMRREGLKIVANLDGEAKVAGDRVVNLQRQLTDLKQKVKVSNIDEVKLRELERVAATDRKLLEELLAKYAEANASRTNAALNVSIGRIIERAIPPNTVSFPRKGPIYLLGLLSGLALGLGFAFLSSLLKAISGANRAVNQTARDVKELRTQPFSSPAVPDLRPVVPLDLRPSHIAPEISYPTPLPPRPQATEVSATVASTAAASAPSVTPEFKPASEPASAMAASAPVETAEPSDPVDYVRSIVDSEITARKVAKLSFVGIGGAANEGAAVAISVARNCAAKGRKVLLIDCDGEHRAVEKLLGLAPAEGLAEAVSGAGGYARIVAQDPGSNVHVIRYGNVRNADVNHAIGQRLPSIMQGLVGIYNVVLLHGGAATPDKLPILKNFPVAFLMSPNVKHPSIAQAADSLVNHGVGAVHFIETADTSSRQNIAA